MVEAVMSASSSSSNSLHQSRKRSRSPSSSGSESLSRSPSPSLIPFEPAQELLETYQSLLSSTFDLTGLIPTQPREYDDEDSERVMTKAEKQNAKKKRRKAREREAKLAESGKVVGQAKPENSIEFRLFSSCPIRSVKLEDELVEYPCPTNPRHRLITGEETMTRRHRAEASAVTAPDLGGPSTIAERWYRSSRTPRSFTINTTESLPDEPLAILQIDQDHGSAPASMQNRKTGRSMHLIPIQSTESKRAGVRRGRRKPQAERPPPKYWRPKRGLGGKSQSTIWGYGVGMPIKGH